MEGFDGVGLGGLFKGKDLSSMNGIIAFGEVML